MHTEHGGTGCDDAQRGALPALSAGGQTERGPHDAPQASVRPGLRSIKFAFLDIHNWTGDSWRHCKGEVAIYTAWVSLSEAQPCVFISELVPLT